MFGFTAGKSRILAAFRRTYNCTADDLLSPGEFYQWLPPLFAAYLRELVEFVLDGVAVPHEFDQFRNIMITDATIHRLHRFFSGTYQRIHEEQAGAKFHLRHNMTD